MQSSVHLRRPAQPAQPPRRALTRAPRLQGFKCKFSHDLAVERKVAKIDLFSDRCVAH
jgi:hypothetical protein